MRHFPGLLALPTSLITFLALVPSASTQPWPYNLPPHEKYFPEHEQHMKRNLEIEQKLAVDALAGVRKMSSDEGEKFYMEYWQFGASTPGDLSVQEGIDVVADGRRASSIPMGNTSVSGLLLAPIAPHTDKELLPSWLLPRMFGRRTSNGGCCIPGYTCQGVGCVYAGTATTVTTLPAVTVTTGASSAPAPIPSSTTTTVVVSAASVPTSLSVQTITTTVVVTPSASVGATTVTQVIIITPSISSLSATTTTISTTTIASTTGPLSCSPGFQTCAASLGGGCCPTGRACGSASCPALPTTTTTTTTSASAVAPVRPTSGSDTGTTSSAAAATATTSTVTYSGCPTGFYMCSAYYLGGCCRVGRDCDTTSCPSSASTAVVTGTGLTIVAPVGASSASADTSGAAGVITYTSTTTAAGAAATTTAAASQGRCANGWFSCASSAGGGCCPSGFVCGASCSTTVSGQGNVGKEAPSLAAARASVRGGWALAWAAVVAALGSGAGMLVL
ncbi:hypothetical protein MBLNU459_g2555t1 [Dothideomycetes sp. NU459]